MSSKPKIVLPTDEEDAAINRGIAADPDTHEVSAKEMRAMKPLGKRGRGRPRLASTKELVSIRYDADLLDAFRASGEGWQTLMNATLNVAIQQAMGSTYIGGPLHGTTVRDNPDTLPAVLTHRPVTAFANDPAYQATYRRVTLERIVGNNAELRDFFVSDSLTDGEADALVQRENLWPMPEPHHA
jgi:uncharacterized protein (DUF4415 family)